MKPTDKTPADTDRAYLLRCWREGAAWRFSLEPIGPQSQRRGFATLEAMVEFLAAEFGWETHTPTGSPEVLRISV